MNFLAKYTTEKDVRSAIEDLKNQYSGFPVKLLIYFASTSYDSAYISAIMPEAFPGALVFGCSSYAEIVNAGIHHNSIAAMAFSEDAFEAAAVTVAKNISSDPWSLEKAFARLEKQLDARVMDLNYKEYFGLTLFDGGSAGIENFLERIGNISDITFIGGYASDNFTFTDVKVYYEGQTHSDAAVLAILKPRRGFSLLKTQSAVPTEHSFLVTSADEANKIIHTLDNRPAVEVYAEAMGMKVEDLTPEVFLYHPFGLMVEDQPFIRTIRQKLDNGCVQLFCAVKDGLRLRLMKPSDIVERTAKDLAVARQGLAGIRAILDFDCAHRALMLAESKNYPKYAQLFDGIETAGFSTYGETYIGFINQTSVMALFE